MLTHTHTMEVQRGTNGLVHVMCIYNQTLTEQHVVTSQLTSSQIIMQRIPTLLFRWVVLIIIYQLANVQLVSEEEVEEIVV